MGTLGGIVDCLSPGPFLSALCGELSPFPRTTTKTPPCSVWGNDRDKERERECVNVQQGNENRLCSERRKNGSPKQTSPRIRGFQLVQSNLMCKDLTQKLMNKLMEAVREGRREQASRKNTEEQIWPSWTREGQSILVSLDLCPQLVQQTGGVRNTLAYLTHLRKWKQANESDFFFFFYSS